ncbi:molecular chaperone [Stenotrophomonas forensis]|uniref:fimbrial biogenesis chaperone n=1 Tax=Stenotrophomonas forensis TaxID=2871169 RepID=UPI0036D4473F
MSRVNRNLVLATAMAAIALVAQTAEAGVVISGTRVIFPERDHEVTLRLANTAPTPVLVQSWIDDGDARSTPEQPTNVPFVIRPPVFRMNANSGQVLRIVHTGQPMPADRESLYYLNILDVPGAARATADQAQLHLVVRSRLKLFYRPKGLTAAGASKAPSQLVWSASRDGSGWVLRAANPTAYHVNINAVTTAKERIPAGLAAPFSTASYKVSQAQYNALGSTVNFEIVNDYGATAQVAAPLARP